MAEAELVGQTTLRAARRRALLPRRVLFVTAAVLSLLGVRGLVRGSTDVPSRPKVIGSSTLRPEMAGFAESFARAYLTWDALHPEAHAVSLAAFLGPDIDVDAGLPVPVRGRSRVVWSATLGEVVTDRDRSIVTVALALDSDARLRYLAVPVSASGGGLAVPDYPALVGRPNAPALPGRGGDDIEGAGLSSVVRRALSNYLSGEADNLRADLLPGAQLPPPAEHLNLDDVVSLQWAGRARGRVSAVIVARDPSTDVAYTLRYELRVARRDRWYVAEINPPLARKEPS